MSDITTPPELFSVAPKSPEFAPPAIALLKTSTVALIVTASLKTN